MTIVSSPQFFSVFNVVSKAPVDGFTNLSRLQKKLSLNTVSAFDIYRENSAYRTVWNLPPRSFAVATDWLTVMSIKAAGWLSNVIGGIKGSIHWIHTEMSLSRILLQNITLN